MTLNKKELGSLIKQARKQKAVKIGKKYTQQMLANDIEKSQSYIGDIESGRTYPSYPIISKIAIACNVPLSYFQIDMLNYIGVRLRELRAEANLTLQQLGAILDIPFSSLVHFENNEDQPDDDTLWAISNYFNVSVDYLLSRTNMRDSADALWLAKQNANLYLSNLEHMSITERDLVTDSMRLLQNTLFYNLGKTEALQLIHDFVSISTELADELKNRENKNIPESIRSFGEAKAIMDSIMNRLLQKYISEPDKPTFNPSKEIVERHYRNTGDTK